VPGEIPVQRRNRVGCWVCACVGGCLTAARWRAQLDPGMSRIVSAWKKAPQVWGPAACKDVCSNRPRRDGCPS
jgi:hypothetical protein